MPAAGDQLREKIAKLSPEQRTLLAKRASAAVNAGIPRRAGSGPAPLSFAQRRLWGLDQAEPGNTAGNVSRAVLLSGPLNEAALAQALSEIVRRHEILRTTFPLAGDAPVQQIADARPARLPSEDLSQLESGVTLAEARRRAAAMAATPFDLAADQLFRVRLFRLGAERSLLALVSHQIAMDEWSAGILARELLALYHAFASGSPSPLPELPLQFADYAEWERGRLDVQELERLTAYWRGKLSGMRGELLLPGERALLPQRDTRRGRHCFTIPNTRVEELRGFARRQGATLFTVLLAAYQVLLSRYAELDDVAVGCCMPCREAHGLEALIGCFSNTLVLRTSFAGNPTFEEALRRTRETVTEALAHELLPFETLVETLQAGREQTQTILPLVSFRMMSAPRAAGLASGLQFEFLESDERRSESCLAMELVESAEGLSGYLEYGTGRFPAEKVALIASDYEELPRVAVANPGVPLGELPFTPRWLKYPAETPRMRRSAVHLSLPSSGSCTSQKPAAPEYQLRPATIRDARFIYEMRAHTMEEYVAERPGWSDAMREAFYMDFDIGHHRIIAIGGKPVGAIAVIYWPSHVQFINVHLVPAAQKGGLGTRIMRHVAETALHEGMPVTAKIFKVNVPSMKVLTRIGMRICGENQFRYHLAVEPEGNRWLAYYKPNPDAKVRLFCLSDAAAGAAQFRDWSDELPVSVEVMPVELPGCGSRGAEPPLPDMATLVDWFSKYIQGYFDKPFCLYGHGAGAVVMFELARRLRTEEMYLPCHLFVAGCAAPQLRTDGRAEFGFSQPYRYSPEDALPCAMTVLTGDLAEGNVEAWREHTSGAFRVRRLLCAGLSLETDSDGVRQCVAEELERVVRAVNDSSR